MREYVLAFILMIAVSGNVNICIMDLEKVMRKYFWDSFNFKSLRAKAIGLKSD